MANNQPLTGGRLLARKHQGRAAAIDELMNLKYLNGNEIEKYFTEFIDERVKFEIETIWKDHMKNTVKPNAWLRTLNAP